MYGVPTNEVTIQPACEPVTPAEVQANAWIVDSDGENAFIRDQLIPTARRYVENLANRSLITQTRRQSYDYMPASPVTLRHGPIASSSITFTYLDTSETTRTLASTEYNVDTRRIPGRVVEAYQKSWPTALYTTNAVSIVYQAGYGTNPSSVPIVYRRAIILLCTHWFNNRDDFGCAEGNLLEQLECLLAIEGRTVEYA